MQWEMCTAVSQSLSSLHLVRFLSFSVIHLLFANLA